MKVYDTFYPSIIVTDEQAAILEAATDEQLREWSLETNEKGEYTYNANLAQAERNYRYSQWKWPNVSSVGIDFDDDLKYYSETDDFLWEVEYYE